MAFQEYKDAITREVWLGTIINPVDSTLVLSARNGAWKIFHTQTGKPFLSLRFANKELAMRFGEMLYQWYGEYLWIWDDPGWKGKDIPMLVQYTIPHGEQINESIRKMERIEMIEDLKLVEGL